jgi:hypothetical protein
LSARSRYARGSRPAQLDLHEHVVERGAPVEQHRALEHDAEVGLRPVDDAAGDARLARAREVQPRDDAQQRALAAARRPDDREELAGADRQVDRVERVRLAPGAPVGLRDAAQLDVSRSSPDDGRAGASARAPS